MDSNAAARRVARFESTLDPRVLWPDVTEQAFRAAMREIVRATSARLADEGRALALTDPIPGGSSAFGAAAFASGLGPLLGYWIEQGVLEAPTSLADLLRLHLDHGRRRGARLRAELERIVHLFADAGIGVVVLKGMHTGWAHFPDPGTRPATDIDILIRPQHVADAQHLLEQAGFRKVSSVPQRSTWEPAGAGAVESVLLTHADNPWTLDLHETLDRQFADSGALTRFALGEEEDLEAWHVGGAQVRVLSQPLLTCFLAVHASHHFPYVSTLRLVELVLVLGRDGESAFPWERLAERLARTGAQAYAYPALKLAADFAPGAVDPALLDQLRAVTPPRVRDLMDRVAPATALQIYRRSFEGRFLWTGSRWARWAAFVAWLWPRDSVGARVPLPAALGITGRRLRRLVTGRLSWRSR
jgi:hypothetical protein